jgi:hypothetical protein
MVGLMAGPRRAAWLAAALYLALTVIYFTCAAPERVWQHTPYNHFAHQARSWLDGRLELGYPPPPYAHGNDFARFEGRWYIVFPSFPAVLLLPAVALAGRVEDVRDGQVFLWLAGAGPALFFLALERLRELGRSAHGERTHLALAALLGLGTVYWFCAEQGTVWFAAHVVGVALAALYLRWSLGGAHPLLAGLALGLGYWTRASLLFAFPLFVIEATAASLRRGTPVQVARDLARRLLLFALPLGLLLGLSLWHNYVRFHDPFEVGYRYLTVAWQARIEKWGLFSYHYLARNLGVLLASLPFQGRGTGAPLQISIHGLALWVTTPVYLLLLWPRRKGVTWWALGVTAAAVALPSLLYQNTGQVQFGYRFSCDYAVFLLAMVALSRPRLGGLFWALGLWGVLINAFGALTFDRSRFTRFYADERTGAIYQPD